jgi:hypothetical protein
VFDNHLQAQRAMAGQLWHFGHARDGSSATSAQRCGRPRGDRRGDRGGPPVLTVALPFPAGRREGSDTDRRRGRGGSMAILPFTPAPFFADKNRGVLAPAAGRLGAARRCLRATPTSPTACPRSSS